MRFPIWHMGSEQQVCCFLSIYESSSLTTYIVGPVVGGQVGTRTSMGKRFGNVPSSLDVRFYHRRMDGDLLYGCGVTRSLCGRDILLYWREARREKPLAAH